MTQHSLPYDCIIIGKGLIGSAAAKYLKNSYERVAIIGPDEPLHDLNTAQVFASHYDQARVQRVIGVDPVWTRLNQQSAAHYPQLEKESDIPFHYPVGCLYVSPHGKDDYLKKLPEQANQLRLPYQFFENADLIHKALPHYTFPTGAFGMLEPAPSGHINPMQLILAQLKVFKNREGEIFKDTVLNINSTSSIYKIKTEKGLEFSSSKVLVTAGAFSNFNGLLPRPLDLEMESETVLLAQVSEEEAQRLANLPSLLYELDTDEVEGIYLVRPVKYPDGQFYLKMGCNLSTDITFTQLEEIQHWFRYGNTDTNEKMLRKALHYIMPDLKTIGYKTKKCIISRTKHKHCYIGDADQRNLYVAAGGNGYSAMCSDALGSIAAYFTKHNDVPFPYSAKSFEPVFI
ncbi:FAD-binding oxidoreductase [Flammeovirgaceae bacterium]